MAIYYLYMEKSAAPLVGQRLGPFNAKQLRSRIQYRGISHGTPVLRVRPNSSDLRPAAAYSELAEAFPKSHTSVNVGIWDFSRPPSNNATLLHNNQAESSSTTALLFEEDNAEIPHPPDSELPVTMHGDEKTSKSWDIKRTPELADYLPKPAQAQVEIGAAPAENPAEAVVVRSDAKPYKDMTQREKKELIQEQSRQYANRARQEEYKRRRKQLLKLIGGFGLLAFFVLALIAALVFSQMG